MQCVAQEAPETKGRAENDVPLIQMLLQVGRHLLPYTETHRTQRHRCPWQSRTPKQKNQRHSSQQRRERITAKHLNFYSHPKLIPSRYLTRKTSLEAERHNKARLLFIVCQELPLTGWKTSSQVCGSSFSDPGTRLLHCHRLGQALATGISIWIDETSKKPEWSSPAIKII